MATPNLISSLQNMISEISSQRGLIQQARYRVIINLPAALLSLLGSYTQHMSIVCHEAKLPGKSLATDNINEFNGPKLKMPYQEDYQDIGFSYICTGNFIERAFFDIWMNLVVNKETHLFNFRNEYSTKIQIFQLNSIGEQIYGIELESAYPIAITEQNLTYSDENFQQLSVTLNYYDYSIITGPGASLVKNIAPFNSNQKIKNTKEILKSFKIGGLDGSTDTGPSTIPTKIVADPITQKVIDSNDATQPKNFSIPGIGRNAMR